LFFYKSIKINLLILISFSIIITSACSQQQQKENLIIIYSKDVKVGAERTEEYLPLIKNKNIAIVANHTSLIKNTHLVDSLLNLGINITKVFSPEHGFRGTADAGASIENKTDKKTGLPVISLYGKNKKPKKEDLSDIDIMIFDIQDVGARFYTYISTMTYVLEACAENNIPVIILDRPNPNGFYVDGPVLEKKYKSFIGMHPVPVVHGMTTGEYAKMVNEEGWLKHGIKCHLNIIKCLNYDHTKLYQLTVKPSPNLPSMNSVYLYPSLCFFEGTIISIGRGTDASFELIGHPDFSDGDFTFTPKSIPGASLNPPYKNIGCRGYYLKDFFKDKDMKKIHLNLLIEMYDFFKDKNDFFNSYFDKLAGTSELREQIIAGKSEEEIRKSWQEDIDRYKKIRKKYLLYPDFE
jgi:uncharacterized protein YbbC (DUF1343 family)